MKKIGLMMAATMAATMMGAAAHASVITSADGLTFNAFPVVNSYNDAGPEVFGSDVTYTSNDSNAVYGYNEGYGFIGNGYSYDLLTGTNGTLDADSEINFAFTQPVSAAGFQANWADSSGVVTITAFDSSGAAIESLALADSDGNNLATPDTFYGFRDAGIASIGIQGTYVAAINGVSFGTAPVSAAPEPGVWALMLAGVAMIGLTLRQGRRQRGIVLAA